MQPRPSADTHGPAAPNERNSIPRQYRTTPRQRPKNPQSRFIRGIAACRAKRVDVHRLGPAGGKIAQARWGIFWCLKKGTTDKFRFNLPASNGQVIATSEAYATKAACMNGIASVRKHAADAKVEDLTASKAKS